MNGYLALGISFALAGAAAYAVGSQFPDDPFLAVLFGGLAFLMCFQIVNMILPGRPIGLFRPRVLPALASKTYKGGCRLRGGHVLQVYADVTAADGGWSRYLAVVIDRAADDLALAARVRVADSVETPAGGYVFLARRADGRESLSIHDKYGTWDGFVEAAVREAAEVAGADPAGPRPEPAADFPEVPLPAKYLAPAAKAG